MLFSRGFVQEQAGGFDHNVSADLVPLQGGGVALLGQANLLAVDDQGVAVDRNLAFEAAMHAVVLEHVGQVVGFEQVVDANHFDVLEVLCGGTEHHATDAAKAVDTDFDGHGSILLKLKIRRGPTRLVPCQPRCVR